MAAFWLKAKILRQSVSFADLPTVTTRRSPDSKDPNRQQPRDLGAAAAPDINMLICLPILTK
jgi:hypothetical protein